MKKLLFLMALVLPLAFVSCGGDDDGDDLGKDDVNSNLPKEAQAFIGAWNYNVPKGEKFIFFEDGSAWYYDNQYDRWKEINDIYERHEVGEWTYDPSTKILSTTFVDKQYQVTLSSEKSWAGINLSNNKTVTFEKHSDWDIMYFLLKNYKWENKAGKDFYYKDTKIRNGYETNVFELTNNYPLLGSIIDEIDSKLNYSRKYLDVHFIYDFYYTLNILSNEKEDYNQSADFVLNGYHIVRESSIYHSLLPILKVDGTKEENSQGTIKIVNPFKPGKAVLKITGSYLEGEYNMKKRD